MSTLPDDITPERLLKMREERGGPWRPTAEYQESLAKNAELTKEAADPRGPLWDTDRKDEAFMQPPGAWSDGRSAAEEMSLSDLPEDTADELLYE